MKRIFAFLRALFCWPKRDLRIVKFELESLRKKVVFIKPNPNKVRAMVELIKALDKLEEARPFDKTISRLEKKNYGQLDETLGAFYELKDYLRSARRGKFGHNRAETGQVVSLANVYLGGSYGLDIEPASFWLENRKELDKVIKTNIGMAGNQPVTTWWLVSNRIAGVFVKETVDGIVECLDIIEKSK